MGLLILYLVHNLSMKVKYEKKNSFFELYEDTLWVLDEEKESILWEVFIQPKNGLSHRHCGSIHAPDREMAILSARNVYSRRGEGQSIWVVRSIDIVSSNPDEKEETFSSDDKIYRHPTFYDVPDDVGHM